MKKLLLTTSALLLGLTFAGSATAHEHHGHHGSVRIVVGVPYYRDHGVHFAGGYYYRGYDHPHWAYRTWDPVYARYVYWDPYLHCYYFWDAGRGAWYPVGY